MKMSTRILFLGSLMGLFLLSIYASAAGTDFIYTTTADPKKEAYIYVFESNVGGSEIQADFIIRMQSLLIDDTNSSAIVTWSIETEYDALTTLLNGTDSVNNIVYADLTTYSENYLLNAAALGWSPASVLYIVAVNATDGNEITGTVGNLNVSVQYDRATGMLRSLRVENTVDNTYVSIYKGALPKPLDPSIWSAYVVAAAIIVGSIIYILTGNKKGGKN